MLKNTSPERKRSWIWSCWCESDVAASYAERGKNFVQDSVANGDIVEKALQEKCPEKHEYIKYYISRWTEDSEPGEKTFVPLQRVAEPTNNEKQFQQIIE